MGATNYFKGKYMDGTFSSGEGPVLGQKTNMEGETKGYLGTDQTSGQKLKTVDGKTTFTPASGDDGLFSLRAKSYTGPQNFVPDNKGVVPNFDINKG
jgi:hypothetical protein